MTGHTKALTPLVRAREAKREHRDRLEEAAQRFALGRVGFEELAEAAIDFAGAHHALVAAYRAAEGRR